MLWLDMKVGDGVVLDFSKCTEEEFDALLSGEKVIAIDRDPSRTSRFSFDAPRSVMILRRKLWNEQQEADAARAGNPCETSAA